MSNNVLPDDLCTLQTCSRSQSFLDYEPNLAGNVLYLTIFAVLLVAQLGLGIFYRTWSMLVCMFCCLVLEIIGYAGRLMMRGNPFIIGNFLLYYIPTSLGPAFLAGAIYLTLGRIVVVYSPLPVHSNPAASRLSLFEPRTYYLIFCTIDIASLVIQAVGGGLTATATTEASQDSSTDILIAGLALQAASLAGFLCAAADVWRRVRKSGEGERNQDAMLVELRAMRRWRAFLVAVSVAAILVFVRTIYRVVELSGGFRGALANEEIPFMILEGPMIIIATVLLTIWHPGVVYRGGYWQASAFPLWKSEKAGNAEDGVQKQEKETTGRWRMFRKRGSDTSSLTMVSPHEVVEKV